MTMTSEQQSPVVFLDTWAFQGFFNARDPRHASVSSLFDRFADDNTPLWTCWPVVFEFFGRIATGLGRSKGDWQRDDPVRVLEHVLDMSDDSSQLARVLNP